MTYEEIKNAMNEVRSVMNRADEVAKSAIMFSVGRLRRLNIPVSVLNELKKELKNYNIHTRSWSNE